MKEKEEVKWNFKQELARKSVHIFAISILFVYFIVSDLFSKSIALLILASILVLSLEFEYLRIEIGNKIPVLNIYWV